MTALFCLLSNINTTFSILLKKANMFVTLYSCLVLKGTVIFLAISENKGQWVYNNDKHFRRRDKGQLKKKKCYFSICSTLLPFGNCPSYMSHDSDKWQLRGHFPAPKFACDQVRITRALVIEMETGGVGGAGKGAISL